MSNIPSMPSAPSVESNNPAEEVKSPAGSVLPSMEKDSEENKENSEKIVTQVQENSSLVNLKNFPQSGIKVKAIRNGFFQNRRIAEGECFTIKDPSQFGEWMICLDKDLEKKRKELLKQKKEKAK